MYLKSKTDHPNSICCSLQLTVLKICRSYFAQISSNAKIPQLSFNAEKLQKLLTQFDVFIDFYI